MPPSASPPMANLFLLGAGSLFSREVKRFYRQPSRVVGGLASPVLFWFLIGSGLGRSFQDPTGGGGTYLEYFFPGTLVLIILFTAIFATVSVIEDRREGFLQGVLVSPLPRCAMVLGKVLGAAALGFLQGLLFLALAAAGDRVFPLAAVRAGPGGLLAAAGVMAAASFGLASLGFILAWRMESVQGFHALMNLFLIPLWLLSGALFPPDGAFPWVRAAMEANPLTYAVAALRTALRGEAAAGPSLPLAAGVTVLFSILAFAAACLAGAEAAERSKPDGR